MTTDKNQRCIGNIVIESEINGKPTQLVGFENHGGQTHDVEHPFGRVLAGNGNTLKNAHEGMRTENFIGTYLHGPLLSKNPELSDAILTYCLERKTSQPVHLAKLDDHFEHETKREMLAKLL